MTFPMVYPVFSYIFKVISKEPFPSNLGCPGESWGAQAGVSAVLEVRFTGRLCWNSTCGRHHDRARRSRTPPAMSCGHHNCWPGNCALSFKKPCSLPPQMKAICNYHLHLQTLPLQNEATYRWSRRQEHVFCSNATSYGSFSPSIL